MQGVGPSQTTLMAAAAYATQAYAILQGELPHESLPLPATVTLLRFPQRPFLKELARSSRGMGELARWFHDSAADGLDPGDVPSELGEVMTRRRGLLSDAERGARYFLGLAALFWIHAPLLSGKLLVGARQVNYGACDLQILVDSVSSLAAAPPLTEKSHQEWVKGQFESIRAAVGQLDRGRLEAVRLLSVPIVENVGVKDLNLDFALSLCRDASDQAVPDSWRLVGAMARGVARSRSAQMYRHMRRLVEAPWGLSAPKDEGAVFDTLEALHEAVKEAEGLGDISPDEARRLSVVLVEQAEILMPDASGPAQKWRVRVQKSLMVAQDDEE